MVETAEASTSESPRVAPNLTDQTTPTGETKDKVPNDGEPAPGSRQVSPEGRKSDEASGGQTDIRSGTTRRTASSRSEWLIWLLISLVPSFYWVSAEIQRAGVEGIHFGSVVHYMFAGFLIVMVPLLSKQIFGEYPLAAIHRNIAQLPAFISEAQTAVVAAARVFQSLENIDALGRTRSLERDISASDPRGLLARFARESANVAQNIYTRAGVYLMGGTMTAFLGLGIFFYMRTMFQHQSSELLDRIFDLIPGLGVLFFIEFVALFLLRQYRAAMDDFRYYDAVRRHREESLVVLTMFAENRTIVSTENVIKAMNIYSTAGKLTKDETTEILETRKLQRDEMLLLEKFVEGLTALREKEAKK